MAKTQFDSSIGCGGDEGWLYPASILDLYSRRVAGWSIEAHLRKELALSALDMAIKRRHPGSALIHHSDRGSQYASKAYRDTLEDHDITGSMGAKGDRYDNALKESFFHTLKVELVHGRRFATRREAKAGVFEYVEVFYNKKLSRQNSFGFRGPVLAELPDSDCDESREFLWEVRLLLEFSWNPREQFLQAPGLHQLSWDRRIDSAEALGDSFGILSSVHRSTVAMIPEIQDQRSGR